MYIVFKILEINIPICMLPMRARYEVQRFSPQRAMLMYHSCTARIIMLCWHDDVIKWKHFPRYWPFVRGIHWSQWIPRTKFSDAELWYFLWPVLWINGWVNNHEAGDLRHHRAHYDVIVILSCYIFGPYVIYYHRSCDVCHIMLYYTPS